jgi:hypothetical protein
MSNIRHNPSATLYQQQTQRLKSFRSLLDPTDLLPGHNVADLYSLRHLCLQGGGIPDTVSTSADGWLRAQAWRVLLGYLSPEKSEWNRILERRRAEYYVSPRFVFMVGSLFCMWHVWLTSQLHTQKAIRR